MAMILLRTTASDGELNMHMPSDRNVRERKKLSMKTARFK
jgi:hypothetical protein